MIPKQTGMRRPIYIEFRGKAGETPARLHGAIEAALARAAGGIVTRLLYL